MFQLVLFNNIRRNILFKFLILISSSSPRCSYHAIVMLRDLNRVSDFDDVSWCYNSISIGLLFLKEKPLKQFLLQYLCMKLYTLFRCRLWHPHDRVLSYSDRTERMESGCKVGGGQIRIHGQVYAVLVAMYVSKSRACVFFRPDWLPFRPFAVFF